MDLNSDAWRDLIFEGKNREYGAYYLRKTSSKRHLYALTIVIGITIMLALLLILFQLPPHKIDEDVLKSINLSNLSSIEYIHFENQIKPETEELPDKENVKTPPEIVDEAEITETSDNIVDIDVLADSAGIVSTIDSIIQRKLKQIESAEDPETYVLDGTSDQPDEIQALQSVVLRYVYQHIKYPDVAYKQKIKGRVVYSFIINKDGSISDIILVESTYIFLDEEVLRVIKSISIPEPVKKNGKPIKVKCYLPVVFSL